MTAPFADQQGSDVLIVDVCPCVIPVVVQQGLRGEVLVKPCLVINRRTVVVGRIYDLAVSGTGAEVDRIILDTAEVAAPPCTIPRGLVCRSLPDVRSIIGVALFCFRILFHTLNKDQSVGVHIQNRVAAFCRRICPVVLVGRIVPLGNIFRALVSAVAAFAVRFIFQVVADDGIVIAVLFSQPCDRILPHIPCDLFTGSRTNSHGVTVRSGRSIIPQVVVVTGVVLCGAVHVDHDFQTVVLHLLHDDVEDLHTVFQRLAVFLDKVLVGVDISTSLGDSAVLAHLIGRRLIAGINGADRIRCATHPRNQKFRGDRHTNQVDTVVADGFQECINVSCVQTVCTVFRAVEAEPVCTSQPDLIAVCIVKLAALCVQPVVVIIICGSSGQACLYHRSSGRQTRCQHHAGNGSCSKFLFEFHGSISPFCNCAEILCNALKASTFILFYYSMFCPKSQVISRKFLCSVSLGNTAYL